MKTFQDLTFGPHPVGFGLDTQARMTFPNGYGVSVVTGMHAYSSEGHPYEVAIFDGNGLTYSTPITDDVIGHQTAEDVTDIMRRVQELPDAATPALIEQLNKEKV